VNRHTIKKAAIENTQYAYIGIEWITEEEIMSVKISKQAHNLSASKWIKKEK